MVNIKRIWLRLLLNRKNTLQICENDVAHSLVFWKESWVHDENVNSIVHGGSVVALKHRVGGGVNLTPPPPCFNATSEPPMHNRVKKTTCIKLILPLAHAKHHMVHHLPQNHYHCKQTNWVKKEIDSQPSSLLAYMQVSNYKAVFTPVH